MCKRTVLTKLLGATIAILFVAILLLAAGCAYKGGRIVDGTNLEIGISVPGTEGYCTINALSYTGGLKVCGDEGTLILVTNRVAETNSYFGLVKTQRFSDMSAAIMPMFWILPATNGMPATVILGKPRKVK